MKEETKEAEPKTEKPIRTYTVYTSKVRQENGVTLPISIGRNEAKRKRKEALAALTKKQRREVILLARKSKAA